ncbi:MAG TPA: DUF302 domain-containing protein [Coriobacteriia bacterium]|jgi:uncharacterized protein (DUF302 family)
MHGIDFEMAIETGLGFDEAVEAVEQATADAGFRVLHVHDVQATLAEKGFEREPMKIVEVCNAKYADVVLRADPRIALMLPCRIVVWTEGTGTKVSTVKPSVIAAFYPEAGIEDTAAEVETVLRRIVEAAA